MHRDDVWMHRDDVWMHGDGVWVHGDDVWMHGDDASALRDGLRVLRGRASLNEDRVAVLRDDGRPQGDGVFAAAALVRAQGSGAP